MTAGLATTETPKSAAARRVDWLHHQLKKLPAAAMPLEHIFTPGLYTRQIFMPAGSVVISRIHKTTHPFIVSKGRALVWSEEQGCVEIVAPHVGVTKPGTQRVLILLEDTVWTTIHANRGDERDVDKLTDWLTDMPDIEYIADMEAQAQRLLEAQG